jgi:hypothetical protein
VNARKSYTSCAFVLFQTGSIVEGHIVKIVQATSYNFGGLLVLIGS